MQDLKKLAKENNVKRMRKKGERAGDPADDPAPAVSHLKEKRKNKPPVDE